MYISALYCYIIQHIVYYTVGIQMKFNVKTIAAKYAAVVMFLVLVGILNFAYNNLGQVGNLSFTQILVYLVPGIPFTAAWLYVIYRLFTFTTSKE